MAQLVVSAAVNIGVGLLLNFLFPPKGQDVEGPRLNDLSVTSSAYGQTIPLHYGTVRTGGNVIWGPPIEEVTNTSRQKAGGKGGGGKVTTTTYTYFASFAIAFGEGVADTILRMWADGKLVYDKTGGSPEVGGLKFRFYRGTETQLPDPLIEASEGEGNVPAHRGLCYMVAERWPLADFGNRIPNVTVELTMAAEQLAPYTPMTLLPGANIPGSANGADSNSHMYLDPFTDDLYMFKTGASRSSVAAMSMQVYSGASGLNDYGARFCMNNKIYIQTGSSNFEPFVEIDPVSMEPTGFSIGVDSSIGSWGGYLQFPNGCWQGVLAVGAPEIGIDLVPVWVVSGNSVLGDGGFVVIYRDVATGQLVQDNYISGYDIGRGGVVIQDHFNRRLFVCQESNTQLDLYEVVSTIVVGQFGPAVTPPVVRLVASYTKGGVDLAGTSDIRGWVVLPDEQALILSNDSSMIKVDMETGVVLAQNLTVGHQYEDGWTTTGIFAFNRGSSVSTDIYTIDTETLQVIETQSLALCNFPDGKLNNYNSGAYDPRNHSIIISRVHPDSTPSPSSERVVRVLLGRANGQGADLADIVADLSRRAGLADSEFDVTDLIGHEVLGYSVTRQAPLRSAIEPLMRGYLFEGAESDWQVKFVMRGHAPVMTIEEEYVGRLQTDAEPIKEVRTQEIELPERFYVRYSDRDQDYQQGTASDRRVSLPVPSQHSRNEVTLDLPIVGQATPMRQLAQRWLYLSWAERASIEAVVPWRYIRLDPTDVLEMEHRGDLRRLRAASVEVGADLALSLRTTQEDARANDSDLQGAGSLGYIPQVIPSSLPTRLLALDLPTLTAQEASIGSFSRAYWAAAGYDSTWPGCVLYRSRDLGGSFEEISATSEEACWGVVVGTIPDPGTVYTWDDSSTITLRVARHIERFTSATEAEVLNGANAIAVIRSDGLPEIIQFVTATQIDAATVQLSRLLRGRRGTEPCSRGHGLAEQFVLLEEGSIVAFQLPLELVGVATQLRAATLGTPLEDATPIFKTYTGQDLLPYSVAQVESERDAVTGDLTISWLRRTRFGGGLRDG
ncbi:MAG TPA: phage tail protein, partial [Trueperaceae bacterium]|nr:phage tail protein [Trueperaceae bacterium]